MPPMNRVLYDYQIFLEQRYGGISRYFCELAPRIGTMPGFSAKVFAPLYSSAYVASERIAPFGIQVKKRRIIWKAYEAIDAALSAAYFPVSKSSIVHETYYRAHGHGPKICPIVVTVHDMIHERYRDMFPASDTTTIRKRKAVERADRVICVSEHTRRDLIELFGVPAAKALTIPHGIWRPVPVESGNLPVPASNTPYLLYVGNREFYKNFSGLLKACGSARILMENFSIIAFGGPPLSRAEFELMDDLRIPREKVRWIYGDDTLLSRLYREATALVYPSLYEGFGIPPLEAMSCDCPVICSNASSIPEVVGNAGVYFDPAEPDAIAKAIESVVNSEMLRASLIHRGRERIQAFSWDSCAAATASVYSSLAD